MSEVYKLNFTRQIKEIYFIWKDEPEFSLEKIIRFFLFVHHRATCKSTIALKAFFFSHRKFRICINYFVHPLTQK